MTDVEINSTHKKICNHLIERQIFDALEQIRLLLDELQEWWATEQAENLTNIYRQMLQFYAEGVEDTHREQLFVQLQKDIFALADKIKENLLTKTSNSLTYRSKRQHESQPFDYEQITEGLEEDFAQPFLADVFNDNPLFNFDKNENAKRYEMNCRALFDHFWLTNEWKSADKKFLQELFDDISFDELQQQIVVAAIFLSLLRNFDPEKLIFLLKQTQNESEEVRLRAITSVILICCCHKEQLTLHNAVLLQMETLENNQQFEKEAEIVVIQLLHALETDRITKYIREDVMPTMQRMTPIIEDYFRKFKTPDEVDENDLPDLEEMIDSLPIKDKIQELAEMELNGDDVYFSTFVKLKNYPFFNQVANWFLPFDSSHTAVSALFDNKSGFFQNFIAHMNLCDSDKYSFCLNILETPPLTREQMMKQVKNAHENLKEMMDSSLDVTGKLSTEKVAKRFVQDIYRFFEIHNEAKKVENPLIEILKLNDTILFQKILKNNETQKHIADFFLLKNFYEQAFEIYSNILKNSEFRSAKTFNNAGYCQQKMGNIERALEFYQQAELLDAKNRWTLQHCAYCCRALKQYTEARSYYARLEEILPNNISALNGLANCFFDQENYQEALDIYFKINYLKPNEAKNLRLIAWCNFMLGNYASAEKFCKKTIEIGGLNSDFLNLGHIFLVQNKTKEAIESYKIGLKKSENSSEFWQLFEADIPYLTQKNIEKNAIAMVKDAIKLIC